MRILMRTFAITFAILALFVAWYSIAANYDYRALADTYLFRGNDETSTLFLKSDGTFQQQFSHDGRVEHATGTWHRSGMAGASFSIGFLRVPGVRTYLENFPDHLDGNADDDNAYYGRFEKVLGVYPLLRMNANPPGPTFHKTFFR
ncbi:MAG: hypothetical protein M3R43_00080 [Acidobacteriota bacterium]|nr:hypothetical protein [Acidobacteriota bacterium]